MGADYPGAQWVPADKSNYRAAGRAGFSLVVIHCTDGRDKALPVAEMWQQPHHGSSAHFVIGQDGTVIQCVRLGDIAWHAHEANSYSVGIEHSARTPKELSADDPGLPPSDEQYAASAQLVAWLCYQHGLSPTRTTILGHAEADKTTDHTLCPNGCGFNWASYMEIVAAEYAKLGEPLI